MRVSEDVIQQLVSEAVASQENEPLGVLVIVLGKDSVSVGGIGEAPSQEDLTRAMASYDLYGSSPATLH